MTLAPSGAFSLKKSIKERTYDRLNRKKCKIINCNLEELERQYIEEKSELDGELVKKAEYNRQVKKIKKFAIIIPSILSICFLSLTVGFFFINSWMKVPAALLSTVSLITLFFFLILNPFHYEELTTSYTEEDFGNAARYYLAAKDNPVVATSIVEVMTNVQPMYVHLNIAFEKEDHSIFMKQLMYNGVFRTDIEEPTLDVGSNVVYLPFKTE